MPMSHNQSSPSRNFPATRMSSDPASPPQDLSATTTTPTKQFSLLLDLPPELRCMVYQYSFEPLPVCTASFRGTGASAIQSQGDKNSPNKRLARTVEPSPLLQCSRQTRTEVNAEYSKWLLDEESVLRKKSDEAWALHSAKDREKRPDWTMAQLSTWFKDARVLSERAILASQALLRVLELKNRCLERKYPCLRNMQDCLKAGVCAGHSQQTRGQGLIAARSE